MKKRVLAFMLTTLLVLGMIPVTSQAGSLPSKYDLRKKGYVTSVKSQGNYGLCWAFAACAAMESNALVQGLGRYDLSEVHLAYFALNGVKNPLPGLEDDNTTFQGDEPWYNYGAYSGLATTFLMNGYGPVKESLAPLSMLPKSPSEELAYGHNVLSLVSTKEIPATDQTAMKRAILENGGIVCGTNLAFEKKNFYNKKTNALYVNSKKIIDHDVVIVGWNDNYSRKNFGKIKPSRNGAWLCKNCWGKAWGNKGYFWLSYEDVPSSYDTCFSYIVKKANHNEEIYQYDGGYGRYGYDDTIGIANVYTTQKAEVITDISAYLKASSGTLSVYKNSFGNPNSGFLLYTEDFQLETNGYHSFRLSEPLSFEKGENFSIVFTFNAPCFAYIDYDDVGSWYIDSDIVAHKGESYILPVGEDWYTDNTFNCRIKAYTSQ